MGTDWVRLFNKRLCDEILTLDSSKLPAFVQSHLAELDEYNELRWGFADDVPASDRVRKLLDSRVPEIELKHILARSLCVFGESLYLDYWACYAEVFVGDPQGSISERVPHRLPLKPRMPKNGRSLPQTDASEKRRNPRL